MLDHLLLDLASVPQIYLYACHATISTLALLLSFRPYSSVNVSHFLIGFLSLNSFRVKRADP